MRIEEIERLVDVARHADVGSLELDDGGILVRLRFGGQVVLREVGENIGASNEAYDRARSVRSPGVGIIRLRHPVTENSVRSTGDAVRAGETVAFLECGALVKAVVATEDGTLGDVLVQDGAVVGYGHPVIGLL